MGCPHPPLTGDRTKAWLPVNSVVKPCSNYEDLKDTLQAVKKVQTALTGSDGGRIQDVPYMLGFTHTGPIGLTR